MVGRSHHCSALIVITDCSQVYFCCPETQGKTLEEIDLVFVSKKLRESTAGQKLIESTGTTSDTAEKS